MFGKLMKHEFRATGRIMLPVLAALIVLTLLANISFLFMDSVTNVLLDALMGLLIGAYFLGIFATGVVCLVIMISRFYRNVLGNEGYITMTLPSDIHGIVWSKLLVSLIWTLVTALVICLTMVITVFTATSTDMGDMIMYLPNLGEVIDQMCYELHISHMQLTGITIEIIILVLVGSLFTFLHFYAAMSLGHIFAEHKVLLSVVFFIAINVALSIFSASCALVVGNSANFEQMLSNGESEIKAILYGVHYMLGLTVVESAILYFTTTLSLKRGLNLA